MEFSCIAVRKPICEMILKTYINNCILDVGGHDFKYTTTIKSKYDDFSTYFFMKRIYGCTKCLAELYLFFYDYKMQFSHIDVGVGVYLDIDGDNLIRKHDMSKAYERYSIKNTCEEIIMEKVLQ